MYQQKAQKNTMPITLVSDKKQLDAATKKIAKTFQFSCDAGKLLMLPQDDGTIRYFCGMGKSPTLDDWAYFAKSLPSGSYRIANEEILDASMCADLVLAWGLTHYDYQQFRTGAKKPKPALALPSGRKKTAQMAMNQAAALNWGRDLINHPSNYLNPSRLAQEAKDLAQAHGAKFIRHEGKKLQRGYPLVDAVGKSGLDGPYVIEIQWRSAKPSRKPMKKVTLVGKGVCFDSGGLDLKPSKSMLIMKKDMGGAAHILALARMIMEKHLPMELRVIIPAVENLPSKAAMRPMDILFSRQGLSVEIGNTDAEGRLILADALTAASEDNPDVIIDFATLTGAARVATGTELPNLFSNHPPFLPRLQQLGEQLVDPLWPMPLFRRYERHLKSDNADLTNAPSYPYAGSITAALFLEKFLIRPVPWIHIDVMGWNLGNFAGKPRGGEIQGVRTLLQFLQELITQGDKLNEYEKFGSTVGA